MGNKEIFDGMARRYDTPERIELADIAIKEIRKNIVNTEKRRALDFGCGTGLVGFELINCFESVVFLDISPGMIECVKEKIQLNNVKNADAICFDMEAYEINIEPVDYILAVNVLLHIQDTDRIIRKLFSLLNEDGRLLIVDFDKNELVESNLVHHGFGQTELSVNLKKIGFRVVKSNTFHHGDNIFMNKKASLFIINAQK